MLRHELKEYLSLILTVGLFLTLCCGGNGSDGGVIPPSLVASFSPEKANPDAMDVSLQLHSRSGDTFTVDVVITDVNGVYSASFDLVYDGTLLDYLNFTEGDFLSESGTVQTSFLISEQSDRVIIGATRLAQVGGVDAIGDEILMSIAFRVKKVGSTSVSFENNSLLNSLGPPPIQGIEWFGGTASGS